MKNHVTSHLWDCDFNNFYQYENMNLFIMHSMINLFFYAFVWKYGWGELNLSVNSPCSPQ